MRTTLITLLFLFLISCKNNSSDADVKEDSLIEESDSVFLTADKLPWVAEYDTLKGEFALKKQRVVPETETAQKLITDINDAWENVKLCLTGVISRTFTDTTPLTVLSSGRNNYYHTYQNLLHE